MSGASSGLARRIEVTQATVPPPVRLDDKAPGSERSQNAHKGRDFGHLRVFQKLDRRRAVTQQRLRPLDDCRWTYTELVPTPRRTMRLTIKAASVATAAALLFVPATASAQGSAPEDVPPDFGSETNPG